MPGHAAAAGTRRLVLLAAVLAAVAACCASAAAASAATLTVTPSLLGGDHIDGERLDVNGTSTFSCVTLVPPGTEPKNDTLTSCAQQTATSTPSRYGQRRSPVRVRPRR